MARILCIPKKGLDTCNPFVRSDANQRTRCPKNSCGSCNAASREREGGAEGDCRASHPAGSERHQLCVSRPILQASQPTSATTALDSGARECSQLRYELCCSLGNEPAGLAVQRGIYCIETVSQKLAGGREPSCEGGLPDKVSKSAPRYPGSSGYQSKTFCLQRSQQRSQICCCWLRGCTGSWTTSFAPLFYQISDMLPPPRRIAVRL